MQLEAFVAAQQGIMEDDVGWGGFLTFEVRIQRYIAIQTSWCGASLDSHIFRATRTDGRRHPADLPARQQLQVRVLGGGQVLAAEVDQRLPVAGLDRGDHCPVIVAGAQHEPSLI